MDKNETCKECKKEKLGPHQTICPCPNEACRKHHDAKFCACHPPQEKVCGEVDNSEHGRFLRRLEHKKLTEIAEKLAFNIKAAEQETPYFIQLAMEEVYEWHRKLIEKSRQEGRVEQLEEDIETLGLIERRSEDLCQSDDHCEHQAYNLGLNTALSALSRTNPKQ